MGCPNMIHVQNLLLLLPSVWHADLLPILGGCSKRWKSQIERTSNWNVGLSRSLFNLTFPYLWTPSQNCLIIRLACRTEGNRRSKFWTWIIFMYGIQHPIPNFHCINFLFFCFRSGNPMIHVQNLLLLLPSVRHADLMMRQFWEGVRRDGKVKLNKLLIEMLESNAKSNRVSSSET